MSYTLDEFKHASDQVQMFLQDKSRLGSFKSALIEAIFRADHDNLDKLYLGFPAFVDAIRIHQTGQVHGQDMVDATATLLERRIVDYAVDGKKIVMIQHGDGTQEIDGL